MVTGGEEFAKGILRVLFSGAVNSRGGEALSSYLQNSRKGLLFGVKYLIDDNGTVDKKQ